MIKLYKLIASVLGIGYVKKGGGTIAAAACCILWILMPAAHLTNLRQVLLTIVISVLGIWSGNAVDEVWGKDSSKVVVDEVAGMMVALLFIPVQLNFVITAFVLFRFFDIAKPLFIRRMELLPKGWGVMADDLLAGLYTNLILELIVSLNIF
jgi:phosphatidylglycerophosphatase A